MPKLGSSKLSKSSKSKMVSARMDSSRLESYPLMEKGHSSSDSNHEMSPVSHEEPPVNHERSPVNHDTSHINHEMSHVTKRSSQQSTTFSSNNQSEDMDVEMKKIEQDAYDSIESTAACTLDSFASEMWRVENIRSSAPIESDWWINGEPRKKKNKAIFNCFDDELRASSRNQMNTNNGLVCTPSQKFVPGCLPQHRGSVGDFRNCGLSTWELARGRWRRPMVSERPPPPAPVRIESVRSGLSKILRTYELPGRMTLPDIVNLYLDIWDAEEGGGAYYPPPGRHMRGMAQAVPDYAAAALLCGRNSRRRRDQHQQQKQQRRPQYSKTQQKQMPMPMDQR